MTQLIGGGGVDTPSNTILQTAQDGVSSLQTAPFTGVWTRFADTQIIPQLEGTATSITAILQTTAVDPVAHPTLALGSPVATYTGSLATGISPDVAIETAVGWWRWNVTALSGGYAIASLRGKGTGPGAA